jgi:hypothetical protein
MSHERIGQIFLIGRERPFDPGSEICEHTGTKECLVLLEDTFDRSAFAILRIWIFVTGPTQRSLSMSQAASQAEAFYREVATQLVVWTLRDHAGFPAPRTSTGQRAQPFWSSRERVEKIINTVPAYAGFEPVEISWATFRDAWIPGMTRDGLLVGINWSGERATGYDLLPADVKANVEARMGNNR